MKQIVSNYSYSPTINVVTLTGVNIEQDQLLLVVAPQVGRTMYNFASGVTGVVSSGANTRVTLNASTAGLTTTSPLVIFYDDHVPATTVTGTVALDSASLIALENVTVTVGSSVALAAGSAQIGSVSISNFPSTQTIAGTVTANGGDFTAVDGSVTIPARAAAIGFYDTAGSGLFKLANSDDQLFPVRVANLPTTQGISGTVSVGNSVTISSLPAISGTVTIGAIGGAVTIPVRLFAELESGPSSGQDTLLQCNASGSLNVALPSAGGTNAIQYDGTNSYVNVRQVSTVTARLQDGSGNNLTSTSIGGVQRLNVSLASAATPGGTLPTFVNVYGGSDSGTVRALAVDSSGRTVVTVSNFPATQAVSLASTTVTVSALPSGALTTRFGSVTTANLSQITTAVTNTSRKYLLAQNISTGSVTIGIGFSPTTTQGIQLTAGAGLTFDAFCPTGAVYWLGAVTGAAWTILEG